MDENQYDHFLNAEGLFCPEPVMMLHNVIRDMGVKETLLIKATDPATTRDVPKFCLFLGHELLAEEQQGRFYFYVIKKGEGN